MLLSALMTLRGVSDHIFLERREIWTADLVAGEEEQRVAIPCKLRDRGKDVLQVSVIVRSRGLIAIQRVQRRVDIQSQVNAGIGQSIHARIVVHVGAVVDRVHTDGIDSQLLELFHIPHTPFGVGDGVDGCRRAAGLVVEAFDVEAVVAGEEG